MPTDTSLTKPWWKDWLARFHMVGFVFATIVLPTAVLLTAGLPQSVILWASFVAIIAVVLFLPMKTSIMTSATSFALGMATAAILALVYYTLVQVEVFPGTTQRITVEKSLYDRLGGKPAITALVDDFVARVAADRRINRFFANTDIPSFKAKLVDQICKASGGPCKYTGKDMKTAHAGMGVTDADFNALVEDLVATLDKFKVPEEEKSELLAALEPMKK